MINKKSIKTGIWAGFLGSLCCTTPLLIIALGIGSIGFALSFVKYRPFFMILGIVFISFALYRQLKKEHGVCNIGTIKNNLSMIITAIIVAIIMWALVIYVIAPFLWNIIYG